MPPMRRRRRRPARRPRRDCSSRPGPSGRRQANRRVGSRGGRDGRDGGNGGGGRHILLAEVDLSGIWIVIFQTSRCLKK